MSKDRSQEEKQGNGKMEHEMVSEVGYGRAAQRGGQEG